MAKKNFKETIKDFFKSLKPGKYTLKEDDAFLSYLIEDAKKYLNNENTLVYDNFTLNKKNNQIIDPSEKYLLNMENKPKEMVILSIDIVGSTNLGKKLTLQDNAKLMTIFSRAIGAIVYNFNGYVLKNIGDGTIAFFAEPNNEIMHDNAIYCAYTIKKYLIRFLNPVLKEKKFPEINFRIGINSGKVIKTIVGYNKIKQHFDLIGETINIASKIQKIPLDNHILLGNSANQPLHQFWKAKLKEIDLGQYSLQKITDEAGFKVYALNISV